MAEITAKPPRPEVKEIRVARPAGLTILTAPPAPPAPPRVHVNGAIDALLWGLRSAWACRRILVFMLAANLALAAITMLPLYGPIDRSLSWHPEAASIGRVLDLRWWVDWTTASQRILDQTIGLLGAAAFLSVLLGTFFAGGTLEALKLGPRPGHSFEPLPQPYYKGATPEWRAAAPGPASAQTFLRESARHFPSFLLYLLISLPLYWAVQQVLNRAAVVALARVQESVVDERVGIGLTIGRAIVFAAAFHAVTVLFEYARATHVLRPGIPVLSLFAVPLSLLRARPAALFGIEAGALLAQFMAMMVFIPVQTLLGGAPLLAVTAGFAAMQIFVFLRFLIRAGAHGAQIRLLESHLGPMP